MYNVVSAESIVRYELRACTEIRVPRHQKLGQSRRQSRCTSLGIGARLAMLALSSRLSKGSRDAIAAAEEAL